MWLLFVFCTIESSRNLISSASSVLLFFYKLNEIINWFIMYTCVYEIL